MDIFDWKKAIYVGRYILLPAKWNYLCATYIAIILFVLSNPCQMQTHPKSLFFPSEMKYKKHEMLQFTSKMFCFFLVFLLEWWIGGELLWLDHLYVGCMLCLVCHPQQNEYSIILWIVLWCCTVITPKKNCKHKIEIVIETMIWTPSSNKLKISYLFYSGVVAKYERKLTQKQ